MRVIYQHQGDVKAYLDFAQGTGLTAEDCLVLAEMLMAQDKPEAALSSVERGLNPDAKKPSEMMAAYGLARLKREILMKLGRGREALDGAWANYREHPSKFSYDELMKYVPEAERAVWHAKALEAATEGDLHSVILSCSSRPRRLTNSSSAFARPPIEIWRH